MTLSKETRLGTITISELLFAQIIADGFKLEGCKGKVWPATKKGRQIGSDSKFNLSDFASAIEVEESADGNNLDLTFNIIVKFGASISTIGDTLADEIAKSIEEKQGKKPNQIKIRVVGVKSKQIAKRDVEVVKNYGTEE